MTRNNPESRAFEYRRTDVFADLADRLAPLLDDFDRACRLKYGDRLFVILRAARTALVPNWERIWEIIGDTRPERLQGWLKVSEGVYLALLISFLYSLNYHRERNELATAGPGLAVAMSFAIVATKYYGNIFADVTASRLDAPWTERVIRANSFLHAVPIGISMYRPALWPFCSGIGLLAITSLNNYLAARLAAQVGAEIKSSGLGTREPAFYERFMDEFRDWWQQTVIYASAVLLIGILLRSGRVSDEWFYASLVAFVANGKMLLDNCIKQAPKVRAGLRWAYETMEKARLYKHSTDGEAVVAPAGAPSSLGK